MRTRRANRRHFQVATAIAISLLLAACGGGDGDEDATEGSIQDDQVVIDPEQLEALREDTEDDGGAEVVTVDSEEAEALTEPEGGDEAEAGEDDDGIEVAEAEEDPIDGMLNSLNVFNACLADEGFELDGFPGDDSGRGVEDFDGAYLQALGACAASSGIQDAAASFAESQANLTPEEIEQTNFGLPVFKECLEDLGWEVGELVPDERGALGFGGDDGFGLTPPDGDSISDFNTDDISACRLEAEQFTAENFEAAEAEGS